MAKKMQQAQQQSSSPIITASPAHEICVEIEGLAPILQNRFSQKTVEQMLRKHMGLPNEKKAKVPRQVLEEAKIYNTAGVVCLPPAAIKAAMITAATTQFKEFAKSKKSLRTQLFIDGNSIPVNYESESPSMAMVRNSGMVPDVRFRPQFNDWKASFIVVFPEQLKVQTVLDFVERAGKVGVCEWRPEKGGDYGTFHLSRVIEDAAEREAIRKACRPPVVPLTIPDWALDAPIDSEMIQKVMASQETYAPTDEDEETPQTARKAAKGR